MEARVTASYLILYRLGPDIWYTGMVANIPFTFRRVWLIVIMYYNLIYDVKYDLILRFGEVFAWLDGEKHARENKLDT